MPKVNIYVSDGGYIYAITDTGEYILLGNGM